jgi:hypothetical protein
VSLTKSHRPEASSNSREIMEFRSNRAHPAIVSKRVDYWDLPFLTGTREIVRESVISISADSYRKQTDIGGLRGSAIEAFMNAAANSQPSTPTADLDCMS